MMKVQAIKVPVDIKEPIELIEVETTYGAEGDLKSVIGGWIEIVRPHAMRSLEHVLVIDEEGRLKDLPVNIRASYLYGTFSDEHRKGHGQPICGLAIIISEGMVMQPEGYPEPDFKAFHQKPEDVLKYYMDLFDSVLKARTDG